MNHYDCLKVTSDAPTEVIRAAYRALAGKRHPDRQGGTMGRDDEMHDQMVAINAAYEVLINPELRAEYDAIQPGFHMSKTHWNTIAVNESVADALVKVLIDHSYELVFKSLTKKLQNEIQEFDN